MTRSIKHTHVLAPLLAIALVAACPLRASNAQQTDGHATATAHNVATPKRYVCPPCPKDCHAKSYDAPGTCPVCGMTLIEASSIRNVAIMLWNGVELLDFAGPGEVFAATSTDAGPAFNVYTVASSREPIISQGFVTIQPGYSIEDCPKPDVIVLPGGGTGSASRDEGMMAWIRRAVPESEVTLSVCTGAFLLGHAGFLDSLEATTHYGAIEGLRMLAPNTVVHENRRFVDNGKIITSAGVSAGIDSSLYLVARLFGPDIAANTARYMEYTWQANEKTLHHGRSGDDAEPTDTQKMISRVLAKGADVELEPWRVALAAGNASSIPNEHAINLLGYRLLRDGRLNDAIAVLAFNTQAYPESFNTYDSLGEALMNAGRYRESYENYARSLELNPDNGNAVNMLVDIARGDHITQRKAAHYLRKTIRQYSRDAETVIVPEGEPGRPLIVSGTIRDGQGNPVEGATVYVFQTNVDGIYSPSGGNFADQGDSLNPRLFGYMRTGSDGRYQFRTIRPGQYPQGGPPPHIHYEVSAPGFRDHVTELMFEDEPTMTPDAKASALRSGFIVALPSADSTGVQKCTCDIVLAEQ